MMQGNWLKRIVGDFLLALGDAEWDFRAAQLKSDIRQSILYMSLGSISALLLIRVDTILFVNNPGLFKAMLAYRVAYVFITFVFVLVLYRTNKVGTFDRLIFSWIFLSILFLLMLNFTRPTNFISTSFDVIIPLMVYMLSPLRIKPTTILALGFSIGTLYVDHFVKVGVDTVTLTMATYAQFLVHIVGLLSALQLQTYRRKSFRAYIEEKDAREMVAYLANIDPLTRSLTRRHFFSYAETEFKRFKRYQRPMSVMIIDADYFKKINDTYGHHAGDIALRSFSLVAMDNKRAQDMFGRLGGEEFGLLLPETNLQQALVVGERIQTIWEQTPVNLDGELIQSTVSIGVAEASDDDATFDDLLRRADKMLYKAKETGRNKVVSE